MKKIYFLSLACFAMLNLSAENVAIVSQNLPGADAIIQKMVTEIGALEGIDAIHVPMATYLKWTEADAGKYDAVLVTENGGSGSMVQIGNLGWPIPVVHLKAYAYYQGKNTLLPNDGATSFYASDRPTSLGKGMNQLIVLNNDDVLSWFEVGDTVTWTEGYNTTIGKGAGEAHLQAHDLTTSTLAGVSGKATPLASNEYLINGPGGLPNFMWKVEKNESTQRIVTWGIHHDFLEHATEDFYLVLSNALLWSMDKDLLAPVSAKGIEVNRQFRLYPNPNHGTLYIGNALEIEKVELIDLSGKVVVTDISNNVNTIQVNTMDLPAGIYIVKLHTGGGLVYTDKLIK
jgi:hypothetical protein